MIAARALYGRVTAPVTLIYGDHDWSRFATPDTSPPWNSPPASPRSFSTTTGPDFGLTGPACETHAGSADRPPCSRGGSNIIDKHQRARAALPAAGDEPLGSSP